MSFKDMTVDFTRDEWWQLTGIRGPYTGMWCWRTIATWSLWVRLLCVMPIFLSLAAETYEPLVKLYDTSVFILWVRSVCLGTESFLLSPSKRKVQMGTFITWLLNLHLPHPSGALMSKKLVRSLTPCLTHRVPHCQIRGDHQAEARRRAVAIRENSQARVVQVS